MTPLTAALIIVGCCAFMLALLIAAEIEARRFEHISYLNSEWEDEE